MSKAHYQRILLKLSGEAMTGKSGLGIEREVVRALAREIQGVHDLGVEVAVVVGGGNIFRGAQVGWMDRAAADYAGMLATMINSVVLQEALEEMGVFTRVLSAIGMQQIAEPYIRRRAVRHMEKKRVVIFGAGTGNPYFSTDTAAALRAIEVKADIILKGTKVDGVYDRDPLKEKNAKFFRRLGYLDVLKKNLRVMDSTSISLCMENKLPIVVFNLFKKGNIKKVVCGEEIGTRVGGR